MTKHRRNRLLAAAISGLALVALGPSPAQAYQTWDDHHLTYGVTSQRFWLADSAVNNNDNAIHDAVALWNATPTPISYSETQTQSVSRMDFYHSTATGTGLCATTRLYVDTTEITNGGNTAPTRNWWWGKVIIYPDLKDAAACGPSGHRAAIVAHEQGHVMGLAHAVHSNRLMYAGLASTDVNAPTGDDVNGINHLY